MKLRCLQQSLHRTPEHRAEGKRAEVARREGERQLPDTGTADTFKRR